MGLRIVVMGTVLLVAMLVQMVVAPGLSVAGWRADLVLVTVVAFALADGPATGARYGFIAGLATDLLSGGSHLLGLSALVYLLVGDGIGRLRPYLLGTARAGELALGAIAGAVAFGIYGGLSALLEVRQLGVSTLVQGVAATAVWTGLLAPLLSAPLASLSRRFSPAEASSAKAGSAPRTW